MAAKKRGIMGEDPVVELEAKPGGGKRVLLDLRAAAGIRQCTSTTIAVLLNGTEQKFYTDDAEGIVSRWSRVHGATRGVAA